MGLFKHRFFILYAGAIVVVLLIIALVGFLSRNPHGEELQISNLGEFTAGKPSNDKSLDWIKHDLLVAVNKNNEREIKGDSIDDIAVRDGSFKQTFDETTNVHTVTFLVDSKTLLQSYRVSYQWEEGVEFSRNTDQYGTRVSCPSIKELIYGEFDCVDTIIQESGVDDYDPVGAILPYVSKYRFTVKSYEVSKVNETTTLTVEAFTPSWKPRAQTLKEYTAEINKWLESEKLDPKDYTITYSS